MAKAKKPKDKTPPPKLSPAEKVTTHGFKRASQCLGHDENGKLVWTDVATSEKTEEDGDEDDKGPE